MVEKQVPSWIIMCLFMSVLCAVTADFDDEFHGIYRFKHHQGTERKEGE